MKKQTFTTPLLMTVALASIGVSGVGCGKSTPVSDNQTNAATIKPVGALDSATTNASDATTNGAAPSSTVTTNAVASATDMASNSPTPVLSTGDTNNPSTNGPATPELAPTVPETNANVRVVEMPATPPEPPKNFFPQTIETNPPAMASTSEDYSVRLRAGYEHVYHGDNNDTWYAGLKFYAYPDKLRNRAGKNAWLIPDADLEFSHQDLAKPNKAGNQGSAQGLNLRTSFMWPWFHWTTTAFVRDDCHCPYSQPLTFTFGPTANLGFDYLFEDNDSRFARYFGARVVVNREAFVEYTVGATDGLPGTRQQVLAEIPFYVTRDQQVRYVFRGQWNHGDSTPDVLEAGLFLEMPLNVFAHPRQWGDFVPFLQ